MKKLFNLVFLLAMAGLLFVNSPAMSQTADQGATTTSTDMDDDDGTDWGWVGLLGLIGLYGLKGKNNRDYDNTRTNVNR